MFGISRINFHGLPCFLIIKRINHDFTVYCPAGRLASVSTNEALLRVLTYFGALKAVCVSCTDRPLRTHRLMDDRRAGVLLFSPPPPPSPLFTFHPIVFSLLLTKLVKLHAARLPDGDAVELFSTF